ncbi:unnamed protein product [Lathyrus oleraceus]
MTGILKLFYILFLFLSIFLIAKQVGANQDFIECATDADCPKSWNEYLAIKCINHVCKIVSNLP